MKDRLVVIGASFNGISALIRLAGALPADLPAAVLVVQHTTSEGPGFLPELLARAGRLPAAHAKEGESIRQGRIYVAPPDRHLIVRKGGYLHLSHGPKENRTRPAVDPTFRSAALAFGPAVVGVVLTGYLDDGTAGLLAVKDHGGVAIAQDPGEATAPSMPLSALRHVTIDHCAGIERIAALIVELALDAPAADPVPPVEPGVEAEARMAEGLMTLADWLPLDRVAAPAGLNCPDCRSALYELPDKRLLRFRCRAGHAFTARHLLAGQAKTREDLVCGLFGALLEEAKLAGRLQSRHAQADPDVAAALAEHAGRLESRAAVLADWLATAEADVVAAASGGSREDGLDGPQRGWDSDEVP